MSQNNGLNYRTTQYNILTGGANNSINNIAPSATAGIPLISQGSSSQPVYGTVVVAGSGTGSTSFTSYSVICAGTTSTGAFQTVSGLGTSGQLLTSNGAGTLPTWQTSGGSVGLNLTTVQLTSAQIKSLLATPIEIVPAQGSGNIIVVVQASIKFAYGGNNAFTNAQNLNLRYNNTQTVPNQTICTPACYNVTNSTYQTSITTLSSNIAIASLENLRVDMCNLGASEVTGNAAGDNTITVAVLWYKATL